MHYGFQGAAHPLSHLPHANSKGSTPYKRTKPSTITRMKEMSRSMKPTEVLAAIDKEVGGIEGAESISSLPRDKQQIKCQAESIFSG